MGQYGRVKPKPWNDFDIVCLKAIGWHLAGLKRGYSQLNEQFFSIKPKPDLQVFAVAFPLNWIGCDTILTMFIPRRFGKRRERSFFMLFSGVPTMVQSFLYQDKFIVSTIFLFSRTLGVLRGLDENQFWLQGDCNRENNL